MKTSELTGAALDWAVGLALGETREAWLKRPYAYSTNWGFGGPIIEREGINVETRWFVEGCGVRTSLKDWYALHPKNHGGLIRCSGYGPTPLIAAMRCFVASKLGDEVEIPKELQ